LTYKEIQDELIATRFDEAQRTYLKRSINHRYQMIWGAAPWAYKLPITASVTVTSGSQIAPVASVASDVQRVLQVYDNSNQPLEWVHPIQHQNMFRGSSNAAPTHWSVMGGLESSIQLGPTPNTTTTFTCMYERKIVRLVSGTTVTTGLMSADADVPIFNDAFHYLLVVGAMATSLKLENDSTGQLLEEEFQIGLKSMIESVSQPMVPVSYANYPVTA
jgi:hypothetical protein